MIAVTTFATKRYTYALPNFGRRLASSLEYADEEGIVIFVGDESEEIETDSYKYVAELLPKGWDFELLKLPINDSELENYQVDAQILIAELQSSGFSRARQLSADFCWSVESDVLVPHNALSTSLDCLAFDKGYYDVTMCSYPSQGGGPFLGGRGDYTAHIAENIYPFERKLSKELRSRMKKHEKADPQSDGWADEGKAIKEAIDKSEPNGNVYELQGKKWKKRGWMEYAYPAIGKGSIVPTDWVGLGCTLMSRKALALAHFDGYQGQGTQDLYIGWTHWKPNGINMAVNTHAICDHVVRKRDGDKQIWEDFIHVQSFHEPTGIYEGHLRQTHLKHIRLDGTAKT